MTYSTGGLVSKDGKFGENPVYMSFKGQIFVIVFFFLSLIKETFLMVSFSPS